MATHDPCALLESLLAQAKEEAWLEFKKNNDNPEEIGQYISALANAAMLAEKDRAFIVFGVDDKSHEKTGTSVRLAERKVGGENLQNWISRLIEPRLLTEFLDFQCDGKNFAIIVIEPTYDRPVRFQGTEYFRLGENKKKLIDFPEHERALWLATGRRRFENAVALSNETEIDVFKLLDTDTYYQLTGERKPENSHAVIQKMVSKKFLIDNLEGRYDITNLGAILLARDIGDFPSISKKSVRIIKYIGRNKARSEFEQEGKKGYAVGFSGMMDFIIHRLPTEEKYISGVRRNVSVYPETTIREIIANALIHQDFTLSGAGPIVEIYDDRVEVTNAGNSLIDPDRMIDERRSRNEQLASIMRELGLCEERGGGLDKALLEIENAKLPALDLTSSENSFRVVLFGPKPFNKMTKAEKLRACFFHCVLRWINHDYMSNATLRERFNLADEDYQAVSTIISEARERGRIAPADPNQGNKYARYVPYWAASSN